MNRIFKFLLKATALTTLSVGFIHGAYSSDTIRIGYQKSAATLVWLKAEGNLEKRLAEKNINVKWTEFQGGPQLLEGLNVGAVDFGFAGETPPIFAQAAGANLIYIANEPASPTAEAILIQHDSKIKNVRDLKGKKVALNKGSNVHYLLIEALKEAGLKYSDIVPIYLAPSDARAAFENHNVDAWAIWDPYSAAAEKQLNAKVLRDGTGIVNNNQYYLTTKSFAGKNSELINLFIEEIKKIDDKATTNPKAVTAILAPSLGLSEDITYLSVIRQKYGVQEVTNEVAKSQQKIADTFKDLKLIPKKLDVNSIIWHSSK